MKILSLLGDGRSGIDLFQSLFDKHYQVSQFPGIIHWREFFEKISNEISPNIILDLFLNKYKHFFDSRLNKRERHDMLGDDKNSFYEVDQEIFKKYFIHLFSNSKINERNILINLHLSYSKASGENIDLKKFIIINVHHSNSILNIEEIDQEIVFMIRYPIASIHSGVKHWLEYKGGKEFGFWSLYFHIERQFNVLKKLTNSSFKIHVVKLEELHKESEKILKEFTKSIGMSYEKTLLNSTYHGKRWWGDALSKNFLNGLNPSFKNNVDYKYFFQKDIYLLEHYLYEKLVSYDYTKDKKKYISRFLKFLPLKIELLVLKNQIKRLNFLSFVFFLYYWIKRVNLMKESNFKNINFPKAVLGKDGA